MTLNEILNQTAELEGLLEEMGGEMTPEMEEMFNKLTQDLVDKVDAYGYLMRKMKSNIEASKAMVKDIQSGIKTKENNYNRLKDRIVYLMTMRGDRRLDGSTFSVTLRDSRSIDTDDDILLKPYAESIDNFKATLPKWIDIKPSISKTALKNEVELPFGADVVTSTTVLIK